MNEDDARELINRTIDAQSERLKTYLMTLELAKARINRLENALALILDHPAVHEEITEIAETALDDKTG